MKKSVATFTQMARDHTGGGFGDDIVAAVPARFPRRSRGASDLFIGDFLHKVSWLRRRTGNDGAKISTTQVLLIFRPDRVDVKKLSIYHNIGETLASFPLSEVSYYPGPDPADTRMMVGDQEWSIKNWLEDDLRAVLAPLGIDL